MMKYKLTKLDLTKNKLKKKMHEKHTDANPPRGMGVGSQEPTQILLLRDYNLIKEEEKMLLSPCNFGESKLTNYLGKSQNVKGWFKRPPIAQIFDFSAQKSLKPAKYCQKPASYKVLEMPKKHFESAFGHDTNLWEKDYARNQI